MPKNLLTLLIQLLLIHSVAAQSAFEAEVFNSVLYHKNNSFQYKLNRSGGYGVQIGYQVKQKRLRFSVSILSMWENNPKIHNESYSDEYNSSTTNYFFKSTQANFRLNLRPMVRFYPDNKNFFILTGIVAGINKPMNYTGTEVIDKNSFSNYTYKHTTTTYNFNSESTRNFEFGFLVGYGLTFKIDQSISASPCFTFQQTVMKSKIHTSQSTNNGMEYHFYKNTHELLLSVGLNISYTLPEKYQILKSRK